MFNMLHDPNGFGTMIIPINSELVDRIENIK